MNATTVLTSALSRVADLSLAGLTKSFGTSVAVDHIDLDVASGDLVSLLGPSGCGKTTTLRMIAGLVKPSAGDILFRGRSVVRVPVHERGVGVLFQNYALFPHMTVAGNVAFGLEMRSKDRARTRALVDDALEMVQLGRFADRYPHELSGGQQQRVALARALVIEPAVLLLDEPFGALDKKLREEMQIQMKDIQTRLKITTIMVTHDQEEALTISDRIAVMNEGRIAQFGTPAEIYEAPASRFVARFIGTSNLFTGEVMERDGPHTLVHTEAGFTATTGDRCAGGQIALSIRPETIRLTTDPSPANGPDGVAGIIERVIYRGAVTSFHVRLASGGGLVASSASAQLRSSLPVGQSVYASWPQGVARVLEA